MYFDNLHKFICIETVGNVVLSHCTHAAPSETFCSNFSLISLAEQSRPYDVDKRSFRVHL